MLFKINLKKIDDIDQNTYLTRTTFLSTCGIGGLPIRVGKHGDVFELTGEQAIRLKKIVNDLQIIDLETYEIPNVSGLQLIAEDETSVTVYWDQNVSYLTEIEVQINDGEWVSYTSSEGELHL